MIVWSDVTDIAAELATVPAAAQTAYLALANELATASFITDARRRLAQSYAAAHFATAAAIASDGAAGEVKKDKAGDLETEYQTGAMVSEDSFGTTGYGRMYLSLIRYTAARAGFVVFS